MGKKLKIILPIVVIIIIAIVAVVVIKTSQEPKKEESKLKISSEEDLEEIIDNVYEKVGEENLLPSLATHTLDLKDSDMISMYTGLENGDDLEYIVVSEPQMTSQAYAFVLAKVKDGKDANKIAKKMSDNVDMRRWVCVEAEKLYATSVGDVVCLIMTDKDTASKVYENFKKEVEEVDKVYEKEGEAAELPPDMY